MTPQQQIQQHMTTNRISIDRVAAELHVETAALRWWLAEYKPAERMTADRLRAVHVAACNFISPPETLADLGEERVRRRVLHEHARDLIRRLTNRGLRYVEIAALTGLSENRVSRLVRDVTIPKPNEIYELLRLVEETGDLVGNERPNRFTGTPHPMLDELAARMELSRLIEDANGRAA